MLNLKLKNSDQNKDDNKLDGTYIEFCIFSLWKIDIVNLIKTKAVLAKNFHIQPSEIDNMQMWEYEIFLEELNILVKDENKEQQDQMDKYNVNKITDPKYMSKAIPKIPDVNVKMSNFKM